jgi:hypothetical protein
VRVAHERVAQDRVAHQRVAHWRVAHWRVAHWRVAQRRPPPQRWWPPHLWNEVEALAWLSRSLAPRVGVPAARMDPAAKRVATPMSLVIMMSVLAECSAMFPDEPEVERAIPTMDGWMTPPGQAGKWACPAAGAWTEFLSSNGVHGPVEPLQPIF